MKTLRPCDCKDIESVNKLTYSRIGHNENNITVEPNKVIMTIGHTTIRISQKTFKIFAEWYLEKQ
jgi:hypothetical protein